jgi:hypothetical protein
MIQIRMMILERDLRISSEKEELERERIDVVSKLDDCESLILTGSVRVRLMSTDIQDMGEEIRQKRKTCQEG